ncbi:trimethyllysine dioxygenase [Coccidioides immitis RS]|uniref:Trimethyllysine dioxygenase n=3 Tax=Coccidioides immitis TaxID=5501 RepID=J3KBK5_COCIM|nr:trimethyllysine dioxygenase [Coccidioides immitis RS]EAS32512.3 trimethyllysine dioxygenase [Coccidioides immitis RS]KMP07749.1 trimethyllysine dioxygenase [Coccidioides immitis RMSCC 2394]KMU82838.1 trimethyllysine dioxygenase [Coccidioides immitis H538.4]
MYIGVMLKPVLRNIGCATMRFQAFRSFSVACRAMTAQESITPRSRNGDPDLPPSSRQHPTKDIPPLAPNLWKEAKKSFAESIPIAMGDLGTTYWAPFWLRENCRCVKCIHPETKQRLVDTHSIPFDIRPASFRLVEGQHLEIQWPDGHSSTYPWPWLQLHCQHKPGAGPTFRPFEHASGSLSQLPKVDYDRIMKSEDGVKAWTQKIHQYGFCFVKGCPVDPEATKKLLERIAFIRPTHYGGFWDFTSDLAMKDMAYTTQGLGVHTDNAYFTDPSGLQMFHLLSHTDGDGGESTLVDGFEAARTLWSENPDAYAVLSNPIFSHHASGNEHVHIMPAKTHETFSHRQPTGELYQIRWNDEDRGANFTGSQDSLLAWYVAAREWSQMLKRPKLLLKFKLEPGMPLIFDNWRMLHGRTAFTGARRMCGGYINRDDFISRYELLNKGRLALLDRI